MTAIPNPDPEAGLRPPRAPKRVSPPQEVPSFSHTRRASEDTEAGCRAKAADDLARACVLAGWPRRRLELSAATWASRADLLGRLDERYEARMKEVARLRTLS